MTVLDEDRQHPATPARLKQAREEGDSAHSHELAFAIQMVAGLAALWFSAASIGNGLRQSTIALWSSTSISANRDTIVHSSQSFLWMTMKLLLPFLVAIFVVGTLGHLLQTRFLVNRPKLSPERISPMTWFGNIFSIRGLGQFTISFPKILVGLGAGVGTIWIYRESIFALGGMPTNLFAASLLKITSITGMSVAVSLLFCSLFDYAIHWYGFQQRNRMTDQELREEIRGQSGDPQVARIRHQRMREITHGRQ